MKRNYGGVLVFIAVIIIIILLFLPKSVGVSDGIPRNVTRFYDAGNVCYVWPDRSGDCYPMSK